MKKILVNFFVFILILSFVFQSSSASAISGTGVSTSKLQVLSDSRIQLDPKFPETAEKTQILEVPLTSEHYLPEHRYDSKDPYADILMDPDLLEDMQAHIVERIEPVEKPEYVPPTPEQIAQTKEQVESFSCADVTDVSQIECEALVALYNSTDGGGWRRKENWLSSNSVGTWEGVIVSSGHVTQLNLDNNLLRGPIPAELGNLQYLPELDISDNYLTGNIPPELGNLTYLKLLVLSNNPLTGSIPSELGNLTNLEELEIMWTQLSGIIPPELGNLTNLQTLTLYDNQLSGNIPPELGNLANLEWFDLSTTLITGNIPPELGELTNLKTLELQSNQLNGSIPPELSNLINLENLFLGNNQLSGSIPPELGNMSNLRWLRLAGNQLSGSIPPELGNLTSLEYLNLGGTQLSGSIPPELGNLSNLQDLSLGYTQVSGTIPPELGNLTNLVILYLVYNQLSGSIPSELGNLANLGALRLEHNQLSGSIPPELGNLVNLGQIYLNENQLTGSIPLSFTQITHLNWFNFSQTSICEPDTPEFLAWKETVPYWTGTGIICEDLPGLISDIEINQALGVQKNNEQNYVAGKPTVIRVMLNEPIQVDATTQRLEVTRDGSAAVTLYPKKNPSETDALEFYCPIVSTICGTWEAGSYSFTANINGLTVNKTATFQSQNQNLRVLLVPIKVSDGLFTKTVNLSELNGALEFMKNTYPVAPRTITWKIDSVLDVDYLDLNDDDDKIELTFQLSARDPSNCGVGSQTDCYDKIIGVLPIIRINCTPQGCIAGFTYDEVTHVSVAMATEALRQTIAHEVGHNFGLGDEYDDPRANYHCDINPPPSNYGNGACPNSVAFEWPGSGSGVLIDKETVHPFEVSGRGALLHSFSFMGNANEATSVNWISQDVYSHLFSKFHNPDAVQNTIQASTRLIQARGVINFEDDSVELLPWSPFTGELPSISSGEYSIEALDVANNILAIQYFDLSQIDLSNPPRLLTSSPFIVDMAYPEGTVRFLVKHGETVISERVVQSTLPTVTIVTPSGDENWGSDEVNTIEWTATGQSPLTYTILYSANGSNWQVLASDIELTSFDVNTGQLPGGDNASIRVIVNDGVNTASDDTDGVITVGGKVPIASILSPVDGEIIPFNLSYNLNAVAFDIEDLEITTENITWSSNVDGSLGTGSNLMVDLSYGDHVITMSAVDSDGNTVQKSVSVFVGSKIYMPTVLR